MQQPGHQQQQQQQHPQQHDVRTNNIAGQHRPDGSGNQIGVFDIPIFTEEFLDHNKGIYLYYLASWILVEINCIKFSFFLKIVLLNI